MDEQQLPREGKKPKRRLLKFVGAFLVLIILGYAGLVGAGAYEQWKGEKAIQDLAESLERDREMAYQARLRDTYGGTTPQETLQMYIDAVEKGDYELASKYFIIEGQQQELDSLRNSPAENVRNSLIFIKQSLRSQGSYNRERTGYAIMKPLLVDFVLYPNGVWKVIKI